MSDQNAAQLNDARALRERYRRDDGWHATNNAQIGRSNTLAQFMENIERLQEAVKTAASDVRNRSTTVTIAQTELHQATLRLKDMQTNLDIWLLAFNEQMGTPK